MTVRKGFRGWKDWHAEPHAMSRMRILEVGLSSFIVWLVFDLG